MKFLKLFSVCSITALTFFSCGKDGDQGPEGPQGTDGLQSLIAVETLAPGTVCASGGINIKSGIDKNRNNILEATEVDQEKAVCNGANGGPDKQIILPLGGVVVSGRDAPRSVLNMQFPEFDIRNYPGVDSVVLMGYVYGYNIVVANPAPVTELVLYNMTDDEPIANSAIQSLELGPITYLSSANVRATFPEKKIKLGLKLTAKGHPNDYATVTDPFLMLYRK